MRNLGLALACVFLTTLLLLADLLGALLVLVCVAATLTDLCGFMHFWGLTIDTITAVDVIIGIGLCVDYSVHIVHAFLTVSGARRERALAALMEMGPAVRSLHNLLSGILAYNLLETFSTITSFFFRSSTEASQPSSPSSSSSPATLISSSPSSRYFSLLWCLG